MSIQFTALGFEPLTFGTQVSSHNHQTKAIDENCWHLIFHSFATGQHLSFVPSMALNFRQYSTQCTKSAPLIYSSIFDLSLVSVLAVCLAFSIVYYRSLFLSFSFFLFLDPKSGSGRTWAHCPHFQGEIVRNKLWVTSPKATLLDRTPPTLTPGVLGGPQGVLWGCGASPMCFGRNFKKQKLTSTPNIVGLGLLSRPQIWLRKGLDPMPPWSCGHSLSRRDCKTKVVLDLHNSQLVRFDVPYPDP